MAQKIYNDFDFQNGQARVLNLQDPLAPQEAATMAYVDNRFGGLSYKAHVRAATTANINLSSAPASIDGITLTAGDRVLVKDQTSQAENGLYIFGGTGAALTRADDANTANELENAVVAVDEGTTNALTQWRQITMNFTLGTNAVVWQSDNTTTPPATESVAGKARIATQSQTNTGTDDSTIVTPLKLNTWTGKAKRASGTFGDASSTQFDVSHNFGTRDLVAEVYRTVAPYDKIQCDIEHLDTNTIRAKFAYAPANNLFRIVVIA